MQDSTSLIAQNDAPIQQNNIPATAVTNNWQNAEGGIQAQRHFKNGADVAATI